MVMLLHLDCVQRNEWSHRAFRILIFYIVYHFVRHYKDKFGIHVNTQTVVTFPDIGTCTTCLSVHLLRTKVRHTLRLYNNSIGSMIRVHIIVVLQIGATS